MELVSVLMCVYNTPNKYLKEAIDSILSQTYKYFEFIIVDDCSNFETINVLDSYSDKRIKVYHNESNLGLTKSLNIGLQFCTGKYIARMDSDDVAEKNRIEKQLEYMKKKSFYIIGSRYELLPYKRIHFRFTEDLDKQRVRMIFGNAGIVHSTAFFEKSKFEQLQIKYNEIYLKAQDYGMWCDCVSKGLAIGLCPDKLIKWRVSENQISVKYRGEQDQFRNLIRKEYIIHNFKMSNEDVDDFINNISLQTFLCECKTKKITNMLLRLIEDNKNLKSFEQEIIRFWFYQCLYRIKYKHKFDFLFSSFSIKIMKPKNVIYLIRTK